MKKATYKTILLFLIYALALNPVSVVLADNSGGLLSNVAAKHCEMEGKAHKSAMKMADKSDCKCKKDCQQGACGQQCVNCGHFFVGLPAFTTEPIHKNSALINITPDLRHQQPMLMHYRPPKTLHS
jgi:hypothetical protein